MKCYERETQRTRRDCNLCPARLVWNRFGLIRRRLKIVNVDQNEKQRNRGTNESLWFVEQVFWEAIYVIVYWKFPTTSKTPKLWLIFFSFNICLYECVLRTIPTTRGYKYYYKCVIIIWTTIILNILINHGTY